MRADSLTPMRVIGVVALVGGSVIASRAAAAAIDPTTSEGWLLPVGFLMFAGILAALAARITPPGIVRRGVVLFALALPAIVAAQLIAFRLL